MANADENSPEQRPLANRVSGAEVVSGSQEIYEKATSTIVWRIPNLISRLNQKHTSLKFVQYDFCNGNWMLRIRRGDDATIGYCITKERGVMEIINGQPTRGHRNIVHCKSYLQRSNGLKYLHRDDYFIHDWLESNECRMSKFPWHQLEESDSLKVALTITCLTCQGKPSRATIPERDGSVTMKRKYSEAGDSESTFARPKKLCHAGVSKLLTDICDFFASEDSDVTIKVKDREFKVHRTMLQARSPVFSKMFSYNMTERKTGVIEIPDCDPEAFRQFLAYLYSGQLGDIPIDIACNLYYIADKYDVQQLKEPCVISMKVNLSVESFCEIVKLSALHNERGLLEATARFYAKHYEAITPTESWQDLMSAFPKIAGAFFCKAMDRATKRM